MKSALTTLFIYTITFLLTLGGLLIAPFAYGIFRIRRMNRPEAVRMLIWLYGRMWVQAVSFIIPVELPEQATASPCVLVANHASFFDVYFIGAQSEWNLSMAVRDWPFKIGVYKPFMEAAEYVRTESGDPERTLEAAQTVLRKGGSILFFPEGTRTLDGKLGRFRSGAFLTAMEAGVPVQPVCISGTFDMLPRGHAVVSPSRVKVSLLPPVYPATYQQVENGHIAMRKDVKKAMADALKSMATE